MTNRIALIVPTLLCIAPAALAQGTQKETPSPLPVKSVTLFSSGVSYTQREGEITGNATIPLTFRTTQINDILKSLVLLDEKGTVQPTTYGAKDPIGRTLQSFAVDVTQSLGQADLLNRLRGANVVVEAGGTVLAASTATSKMTLSGQIVGVESREVAVSDSKTTTVETLTVLGDAGLQSVPLREVRSVKLLDERLNREFRDALTLVASGSDDRRRQVVLHFEGDGKRRVRVGYISEAPLWKISYRLLISGAGEADTAAKPYLQGWAMVENTTDEDWNGIRLALVSGRPVSFIQDLYQPLYLPRPIVPNDVVASPFPQLSEGNLERDKDAKLTAEDNTTTAEAAANRPTAKRKTTLGLARPTMSAAPMRAGGFGGGAGGVSGLASDSNNAVSVLDEAGRTFNESLRSSVATQAGGEKAGELFAYNITVPVTLPRQQAAMIPVVAQEVGGEKVSLYNADSGSRFPLNALRLKNTTALHLKGGPVTVFDENVYAGDARMEDIPPGDSRIITYAVDLSVEGDRQSGATDTETSLSLRRGVLIITRREHQETTYTLKNKAEKPRTVLVEHPLRPEYKLIAPATADERTADRYRFAVTIAPAKTEKLKVVVERPYSQTIGLLDSDLNQLAFFANRRETSEKIQAALREIIQRRRTIQNLQSQASVADTEVLGIDKDQERIRKNMTALDKTSPLYKRYVAQLDKQETRIQNLRTRSASLRNQAAAAERDLRAFLDTLELTN